MNLKTTCFILSCNLFCLVSWYKSFNTECLVSQIQWSMILLKIWITVNFCSDDWCELFSEVKVKHFFLSSGVVTMEPPWDWKVLSTNSKSPFNTDERLEFGFFLCNSEWDLSGQPHWGHDRGLIWSNIMPLNCESSDWIETIKCDIFLHCTFVKAYYIITPHTFKHHTKENEVKGCINSGPWMEDWFIGERRIWLGFSTDDCVVHYQAVLCIFYIPRVIVFPSLIVFTLSVKG